MSELIKRGGGKHLEGIDFSCKHDIMLRDYDGELAPMDEPWYYAEEIGKNTWKVLTDGDWWFVIAGDDIGMCVDSGYGCGNIRKMAEEICGKPVPWVMNTHCHFDHTSGNSYFDCAFVDLETASKPARVNPSCYGVPFPETYNMKIIEPGYVFHLGGRDLEAFSFPDHSPDSRALLDRKGRFFFVGDEFSDWNKGLRPGSTVERVARQLEMIWSHETEFDWCCAGAQIFHKTYIRNYLDNANWILAGHEGVTPLPVLEPHRSGEKEYDLDGHLVMNRRYHRVLDDKSLGKPQTGVRDPERAARSRYSSFMGSRIIYDTTAVWAHDHELLPPEEWTKDFNKD